MHYFTSYLEKKQYYYVTRVTCNALLQHCLCLLDCSELYDRLNPGSGFYRIKPKPSVEPFLVYCDMEDGGGWTVIQKRINGKLDFDRQV